MKQVHNVRIRIIDRDKQLIEQMFGAFMQSAGIERKQAQIDYSDDGEADPLNIGELWLDHQQPVRKAVRMIAEKLPAEEKQQIAQHPEKFIDMATHCFLRLDKKAFLAGEIQFSEAGSTVQVRLNLAAFPANKENAMPVLREIFS